jgi:hypothetical protein
VAETQQLRRAAAFTAETPAKIEPRQVSSGTVSGEQVKSALFTGLVPGEEYVLLVLADPKAEPLLGKENLLFIDQKTAEENGTVSYRYIPGQTASEPYVVACGASSRNLNAAQITFPEMNAGLHPQAVEPVVVYKGKTLQEGKDYVLTGSVSFSESGTYTCYVNGIQNYSGVVECTYQVTQALIGDVSGDGKVNIQDVSKLYAHVRGSNIITAPSTLTRCDFSGDGKVNIQDVSKLYASVKQG